MRVLICGSRSVRDVRQVAAAVAGSGFRISSVVTGGAPGVDTAAERWANEVGLPVAVHPADWRAHGRAAGPIRNREMVYAVEAVIAVWDGRSAGTRDVIERARRRGIPLHVRRVHPPDRARNALERVLDR